MKTILSLSLTLSIILFTASPSLSAELKMDISKPFSQVIISDGIDLSLEYGAQQKVSIAYFNVEKEDILIEVKGKKLKIYLKDCKRGCSFEKYKHANVEVKLTYQDLEKLVVMGDNDIQHIGDVGGKKFTLKVYGDNRVTFNEIHSQKLKTSLYGDNELNIKGGEVNRLKVKVFGDHEIRLNELICSVGKIHAFGDNSLDLQIHDQLNLTMFGDSQIRCQGKPWVDKKFVLGELSLHVY